MTLSTEVENAGQESFRQPATIGDRSYSKQHELTLEIWDRHNITVHLRRALIHSKPIWQSVNKERRRKCSGANQKLEIDPSVSRSTASVRGQNGNENTHNHITRIRKEQYPICAQWSGVKVKGLSNRKGVHTDSSVVEEEANMASLA